ncbi:MAG: ATP-binding protein [bacterium]
MITRRKGSRRFRDGSRYGNGEMNMLGLDPCVRTCLTGYAVNLLTYLAFTESLLSFAFGLLTRKSFSRLTKYSESLLPKTEKTKGRMPGSARHMASHLCEEPLATHENRIKTFLIGLLRTSGRTQRAKGELFGRLDEVQRLFGLTKGEVHLVSLLYCCSQFSPLESLCEDFSKGGFVRFAALASGISRLEISKCLNTNGALLMAGIVSNAGCPQYQLDADVASYLAGLSETPLSERFSKKDNGKTHAVASFNVPAQSVEIAMSLLTSDQPCNILLYGQAGTGKTEFARAIIAGADKEAFFVKYGEGQPNDMPRGMPKRRLAVRAAMGAIQPDRRSVLVIDEADQLLNTRRFRFGTQEVEDKGWLNDLLDCSKHKIIWITNETDCMEESTLRRFSYNLKFRKFTRKERENIWETLVRKHPLNRMLTPELLKDLSVRYEVNAAGIASALGTLKTVLAPKAASPEKVKKTLADLLEHHLEATGQRKTGNLNLLTGNYDITALNTSADASVVINGLSKFGDKLRSAGTPPDGHVNLLFWGRPGTGKTEFAKYLADHLQMGLILKRASDLLNPYVGVTEMLMRDAFEHAERDGSILFLDEADSFFINRETAVRSWETSQTNELLTQMENFKGILICCTNMIDHLDKAALRRFAWKIEFKPLTAQGRLAVYGKYFPMDKELAGADRERLLRISDITPGDIKAVWDKFRYGDPAQMTHASIVEALEQESGYHADASGKIGFGAAV